MKIAAWTVNSIKARLEAAQAWLKTANPDVVCLQEIKCQDENFPAEPFEALGYNCAVHGQKSYNGVAILSKFPLEDVTLTCPVCPPSQWEMVMTIRCYLEALWSLEPKGVLQWRVVLCPQRQSAGHREIYL